MMDTLSNVMIFNCNSIIAFSSRVIELCCFLKKHNISIAMLSETFLKNKHTFNIPGYDVVRNDNVTGRGAGTAILIRHDLRYRQVRVPPTTSFVDVTGVQVYDS